MTHQDLDSFVGAFERACLSDRRAELSNYLPAANHPSYREIVVELVRVDLEFAWNRNEQKYVEAYRTVFPDVFSDKNALEQVAFEEYRLRNLAGLTVSPFDYEKRLSIDTRHWPLVHAQNPTAATRPLDSEETVAGDLVDNASSDTQISPDVAALVRGSTPSSKIFQRTLRRRLRFVSIVFTVVLAYLAGLVIFNPVVKVGLFLGSKGLVGLNGSFLLACSALTIILWSRSPIDLRWLRRIEVLLFGFILVELAVGLSFDLFVDRELLEPLREGDHSLFHYASSWSQPFFALIVAYGIFIPSTWRRCTTIVVPMAIVPLAICLTAGFVEGGLNRGFLQSFLLQMAIWMAIAVGVAVYGVHRIETLHRQLSGKQRIGRYRLVKQLAKGGMGDVYLAHDPMLRRSCAIKLIRSDCAGDPIAFARFEREVRVLARMSHPNAVQIFDYGHTDSGIFYYVMEYLNGVGLDRLVVENESLQCERVVAILLQVCSALRALHSGGLIHRDVKPSNIFVCPSSDQVEIAKLLDFGLVKVTNDPGNSGVTQDGEIIGTPAFMSPEQASGQLVDARTDIYSLGAVAYFVLCGAPPFVRCTVVETLNAHIQERLLPLNQHRADVDEGLSEVIHRCLAKDRDCRFANILELEEALAPFQLS